MKVWIILFLMMFCVNAYGAVVPNSVSGGTVNFNTDTITVTFNTVTKHIYLRNESVNTDCYVNIESKAGDDYAGSLIYYTVKVPYVGHATPNTVELDFSTERLSFWASDGSGDIIYIVTGEAGDL